MAARFKRFCDDPMQSTLALRRPAPPCALRPLGRALLLAAAAWGALPAQAQLIGPVPDAGTVLQEQRAQPPQTPRPSTLPPIEAPQVERPALADNGLRVRVDRVHVTGASLLDAAALEAAALQALPQDRPAAYADLVQAADAVTQAYRARGYLTSRAYLPQQTLDTHGAQAVSLEIAVLEGRYGAIRVDNGSRVRGDVLRARLGIATDEPVELGRLERGLLLIEDLPGATIAGSVLSPGGKVGQTDYGVRVGPEPAARPVFGTATLDNHGSRATGRARLGVAGQWASPTGVGDAIDLSAVTSGEGLAAGRLAYLRPVGARGWRAGVAAGRTRYALVDDFRALDASGTADFGALTATYPIVRSRNHNVGVLLSAEGKRLEDRAAGTLLADKRSALASVGLSGDHLSERGAIATTAWQASVSAGRLDIRNEPARALDAAGAATRGGFVRLNAALLREQALPAVSRGTVGFGSLRAQYAPGNLDTSERMPLGGVQGVRGYPLGEAAADQAWLLNLELRQRLGALAAPWGAVQWRATAFYDAAGARIFADPFDARLRNRRSLQAAGVGLQASAGPLFAQLLVARPLGDRSADAREASRSVRAWVQVGATF